MEFFAGLNYWSILAAAAGGFVVGAIWYGFLFSKLWMRALGKSPEELTSPVRPMITSVIALLIMAWVLSGLMLHIGGDTVRAGLISGAMVWFGFVITTMAVNHAYQGARPMLTLIDGGHYLVVLLVMGAIIGAFGG